MIRSMFTAISSLGLHQKFLDTVSNNLANANTTGYKGSRVLFEDQFAQMLSPGSSPTDTTGGTNPTQVGLGVSLGYISPNFTQGTLQSTGRNMDLAVQGDGFFVLGKDADRRYTREGSLGFDASGFLVNSATGLRVQGWTADPTTGKIDTNLPVDDLKLTTDKTQAKATTNVVLAGNLNADLTAVPVGGTVAVSMGVYNSLGALLPASIVFKKGATDATTNNTSWTWQAVDDPTKTTPVVYGSGSLVFDSKGQYVSDDKKTFTIPGTGGAADVVSGVDFSKLTMLAAANSAAVSSQDGLAAGTVSDVFVSSNDGSISLVYTNGLRESIGQLALARFTNPTGLARAENTTFTVGLNSGDPQIGVANTGGRGTIASGYLEASNVDMGQEFTNMILAQRGFQAAARVITTSDEILQELVALKR